MRGDMLSARAPYNFVPLPEQARPADYLPDGAVPTHDRYHAGMVSGYFDCRLETLTPLYVRSTLTHAEYRERVGRRLRNEPEDARRHKPTFYSPGFNERDEPRDDIRSYLRIPGSSLRGMTRALIEILSASRLTAVSEDEMSYRAVGDMTSLGDAYRALMVGNRGGAFVPTARAGYLYRKGNRYVIRPAQTVLSTQYFRIEEDDAISIVTGLQRMAEMRDGRYKPSDSYEWLRLPVWFRPIKPEVHQHSRKLYYGKLGRADLSVTQPDDPKGWIPGRFIASGWVASANRGKHLHWVVAPAVDGGKQDLNLSERDVQSYCDGGGLTPAITDQHFSVLPNHEGFDAACPCFYLEHEGRVHVGHTAFFRLPYVTRLTDAVPDTVKTIMGQEHTSLPDTADAIFGVAATSEGDGFAGRVFFEDARLDGQQEDVEWEQVETPQILAGPKPTCFQHYLAQDEALAASDEKQRKMTLQYYGPGAKVRGHKLYWHRNNGAGRQGYWIEDSRKIPDGSDTQHTRIRPVRSGVRFRFRVRFENLHPVEVGMLMCALGLPEGCAHKLGMGKPLGLGSVRISYELHTINRQERYRTVFASVNGESTTWQDGLTRASIEKVKDFGKAFAIWLRPQDSQDLQDPDDVWQDSRMQVLKRLLAYESCPPFDRTRYMTIEPQNEYRGRPILPDPSAFDQPPPGHRAGQAPASGTRLPQGIGGGPRTPAGGGQQAPPPSTVRRLSVSREERDRRRREALDTVTVGEWREGRVTSVVLFGAFVDLGDIDGLVHISQLGTGGYLEKAEDVVQPGQTVRVRVIEVDRDLGRIGLSMREDRPRRGFDRPRPHEGAPPPAPVAEPHPETTPAAPSITDDEPTAMGERLMELGMALTTPPPSTATVAPAAPEAQAPEHTATSPSTAQDARRVEPMGAGDMAGAPVVEEAMARQVESVQRKVTEEPVAPRYKRGEVVDAEVLQANKGRGTIKVRLRRDGQEPPAIRNVSPVLMSLDGLEPGSTISCRIEEVDQKSSQVQSVSWKRKG